MPTLYRRPYTLENKRPDKASFQCLYHQRRLIAVLPFTMFFGPPQFFQTTYAKGKGQ